MSPVIKNTIVLVVVAVVVYGLYLVVSALDLTQATFQQAAEIRADTTALEEGVLADLRTLDALELDATLMDTPEYQALRDVVRPDTNFPASRDNPFLPVR